VERLDLNFRAEPASARTLGFSPGWWLWCLIGLGVGYGLWWAGRQALTRRLSDQLATAQSASDAFLALEGLLMLDSEATLEIARGLQHPNAQVARTAYRTLDAQISGWSQLESTIAAARMRSLSQRLSELPETTPPDSLILASSLASRIFSICLELDDPQLAPVMTACEVVFQRIGRVSNSVALDASKSSPSPAVSTAVVSAADLQVIEQQINALRPPPPLNLPTAAPPHVETTQSTDGAWVAPLAQRNTVHSSSSTPTARVQFLNASTRPRSASTLTSSGAAMSLSDEPEAETAHAALSDEFDSAAIEPPLPSQQQWPANVEEQPLSSMLRLKVDADLASIEHLEPDQLVRLLASAQPRVAQAAALALRAKGFSDERLAMASELATALPADQIALLQAIAHRPDLDPRPWLLWMAEDGSPEVRQHSVALLSSMVSDLVIQRDLRRLLAKESDERVAHAIRQVLMSR
jgi:hypothetical protein